MKKFAETVNKNGGVFLEARHRGKTTYEIQGLTSSPLIIFGDWVSPEDHQKVVDDLTNARSSITNLMAQLDYYKKDKRFEAMAEEILSLKSQLEKQQPEIPEFMANYIEAAKEDFWTLLSAMDDSNLSSRVGDWLKGGNFRNQEIFAQAWTNGYTVAKEKRFYLKHIEMSKRDVHHDYYAQIRNERFEHDSVESGMLPQPVITGVTFTQSQIDSMETGSYEKIEVSK